MEYFIVVLLFSICFALYGISNVLEKSLLNCANQSRQL